MSRFELRVVLWSWGLAIDLGLSAERTSHRPKVGLEVAENIWLATAPGVVIWESALEYLARGICRVASRMDQHVSGPGSVLVFTVDYLWADAVNSQDDAIEAAVVGWAAEQLGLSEEPVSISFDYAKNCYVMDYNDEVWCSHA